MFEDENVKNAVEQWAWSLNNLRLEQEDESGNLEWYTDEECRLRKEAARQLLNFMTKS